MGDVAQILGVPGGAAQDSNKPAASAVASSRSNEFPPPLAAHQRPSRAMQLQAGRAVDVITGKASRSAELPAIMVKVGNKFINSQKPARKWTWAPFSSSSRTDGLVLSHWVRANVEYPDYPYARFDIHLDPIFYSDEEYKAYLHTDTWTKSETDLLMDLAKRFELRWPVIHDRWIEAFGGQQPAADAQRSVEDLQHRYYVVAALLTQSRISQEAAVEAKALESQTTEPRLAADLVETAAARALASADPQHQPLMHNLGSGTSNKKAFDLRQEKERRAHLEALWKRTKDEENQEASLRAELKQVEMKLRKLKKNQAHLPASSKPPPPAPTTTASQGAASAAAQVVDRAFSAGPTPVPGTPYLQSARLVPPTGLNKTLLNRLDTVMRELQVPTTPKDYLPTKQVCDLHDSVRRDALTLLILQKHALQKEGLVQARRLKLAKMGGNVRVVDEETLMGIAPARSAKASRKAPAAGNKNGTASKGSGTKSASAGKGGSKSSSGGKSGSGRSTPGGKTPPKTASGGKAAPGGKSSGGKAAPKTKGEKSASGKKTAKRKRKSESSKSPVPGAASGKGGTSTTTTTTAATSTTPVAATKVAVPVTATTTASAAVAGAASGTNAAAEPKSAKKRARK